MSTIVVDTSAAVAILTDEPEGPRLVASLDHADRRLMSAATVVELGIVLEARLGPIGASITERFVADAAIEVVAVDESHTRAALSGWRRFGKGRHPAGLNYGDCFTYALAASEDAPVLCVGDDFPRSDVGVVVLELEPPPAS